MQGQAQQLNGQSYTQMGEQACSLVMINHFTGEDWLINLGISGGNSIPGYQLIRLELWLIDFGFLTRR